jgi:tetratricopeptide (TPR) repeat protein
MVDAIRDRVSKGARHGVHRVPPPAAPPNPHLDALLRQSSRLRAAGRLAESAGPLRQAAQLAPNDAHIHHDLGLTLLNLRQFEPSLHHFERAIAIDPAFGAAHFRRGIVLELLRRPGADAAYERAIEAGFENAGVCSRLAALWEQGGKRGEAAELYRRSAALAPGTMLALIDGAQAALIDGDLDAAEPLLRAVLGQKPGDGAVRGQLGQILAARGDFAAAEATFEQALRDKPDEIGLYYDLLQIRRAGPEDAKLLQRLRDAAAFEAPPRPRIRLQLALAKAHDDRGEYAAAQQALARADALRMQQSRFDAAALTARTDRLLSLFSPSFMARGDHLGSASSLPVLVIGMPRSGTTLLERIIASHPRGGGAGEVHFWEAEGRAFLAGAQPEAASDLRATAEQYLAILQRAAPAAMRVVDKMPFNYPWVALVHLALPNARIVHCRRNAADTCLSIMFADMHISTSFSAARRDLLVLYRDYLRIMAHMRAILPPDRFFEIDYEEVVTDPEKSVRGLLAFCDLKWDAACLSPERSGNVVRTASVWQARQPMTDGSVGRRHNYAAWLSDFKEFQGSALDPSRRGVLRTTGSKAPDPFS